MVPNLPMHCGNILMYRKRDRHPEVRAKRASKDDSPGRRPSRAATQVGFSRLEQLDLPISGKPEIGGGHLRVTEKWLTPPRSRHRFDDLGHLVEDLADLRL